MTNYTRSRCEPPTTDRTALRFLDGVRGLAAAYVVVGHARWLLWEGHAAFLSNRDAYGLLDVVLVYASAAFRYGHKAVLLFFILSGFVIHLRYARTVRAGSVDFGVRDYARRRLRRIYPPLVAALAFTAAIDGLGTALGLPIYFLATPYPTINSSLTFDTSLPTAVGNLLFVMGVLVPVFGSNGPLWSLMYEGWFYSIYPLIWRARLLGLCSASALLIGAAAVCALLNVPVFEHVLPLMTIWWFGALLAEAHAAGAFRVLQRVRVTALVLPALPFAPVTGLAADLAWGLGLAGAIAAMLCARREALAMRVLASLDWLGEFSYSLYLFHFPVLVFCSGLLLTYGGGRLPSHLYWVPAGVLLSALFARVLFIVCERPFLGTVQRRAAPSGPAPT